MATTNDLHHFFECNLPGYQRRDILAVTTFFVEQIGADESRPIKSATMNFKKLKKFVTIAWQGAQIEGRKLPPEKVARPKFEPPVAEDFGACTCGGRMVKRQNSARKNYFLGCSNYPQCKNTLPL